MRNESINILKLILIVTLSVFVLLNTPVLSNAVAEDSSKVSNDPTNLQENEDVAIQTLKTFIAQSLNTTEERIELMSIEGHGQLFAGRFKFIDNGEQHVLKVDLSSNKVWFDDKKVTSNKETSDLDEKSKRILKNQGIDITRVNTFEIALNNGEKFTYVKGEVDGITKSYTISPKGEISTGLKIIKNSGVTSSSIQSKIDSSLQKRIKLQDKKNGIKIPVYIEVNDISALKELNNYVTSRGLVKKAEITKYIPGIAIDVDLATLDELGNLGYVSKVYNDAPLNISLDISVPSVNGNIPGWSSNTGGNGIKVGIIDTGVDSTHPALSGKFDAGDQQDFTNSGTFDDTNKHGTHVAGIVASTDGTYKGVAPGASLINAKGCCGSMAFAAAAIDWAVNRGARVIQMSMGVDPINRSDGTNNWGYGDNNGMFPMSRFVDAVAFEEGVVFSNAIGNTDPITNPNGWVSPPSDAYNVISVGATDDHNTLDIEDDTIAAFSPHGPVGSVRSDGTTIMERHKPDIVAPGTNIHSCHNNWEEWWGAVSNFRDDSGTSMSAPHVSGAAAVLLSDQDILNSKEVKAILLNTASDFTGTRNERGLGELDVSESWIFDSNVRSDTTTGQNIYYRFTPSSLRTFTKATLVWERHTSAKDTTNGNAIVIPISDLDLYLYKEDDNSWVDSSTDFYDNVEQLIDASASGTYIIKIRPATLNNNEEQFSLAYYGQASQVNPPSFSPMVFAPENVALGSTFTVSASVTNNGGVSAHNVEVTLNLPSAGLTIVDGSNPAYVGTLPSGQTETVSWIVRADSAETQLISASINSNSYGDSFTDTSSSSTINVYENHPPNLPTALTQYKSNGVTGIPLGGITTESLVVMKGGVSDPDGDNVQLEVEVRPIGTAFSNTPTCISGPTAASGSTASATCSGLFSGRYHWQGRNRDSNDATGPWLSAGGNAETSTDFEISLTGSSGGPDDFGYTFKDSNVQSGPTYEWLDITTTGTMIMPDSDDIYVSGLPVGFFFNFYGTDYSQVSITNNGIVLASGGTGQYINQPIGSSTPHNFISPLWDDLVTWGSAGAIYYNTIGTAPNRMFVVEWYDNQHYSTSTSGVTFEAILYEGTNNIIFQYKDVDFGTVSGSTGSDLPPYNNGGSATVGIEGLDGRGLQYSYNQQVLNPGLAILFKFPAFSGTNMHLSKNAPPNMDHGNTMTYTLYYNNFGDTIASNVVLLDTLPSNVEFVSASDSGTYNAATRKVTWNIGSVPVFPSGRGTRNVTVRIPASVSVGTVIQNTASISTSTLETRYDDNGATASTTVTGTNLPEDVSVSPINGISGGTPSIYWGNPITYSYQSCPTSTGVDIRIHINDGGSDITGSMTGGPPAWTYTAAAFYPRHGTATITYTIYGCTQSTISFNIYIDPAGYIYDADTGARIAGATVWLQRPLESGEWENVPEGALPNPIMDPDDNPLTTGIDGQYQWDVLAGSYRVHVEAADYYPANSIVVVIIDEPVTDLHVGLTHLPDTTPPVITNISNTSDTNSAVITWDTNEASNSIVKYGTSSGSYTLSESSSNMVLSHSVSLTGLTSDTLYYYVVNSTDGSHNSAQSTERTFRTQALADTTPPVIESISLYPVNATAGATINISVRASDDIGVVDVTANGNSLTGSNGFWNGSITAPSTIGSYTVTIRANDSAGNSAERTANYKVVVPKGGIGVGVAPKTTTAPTTGRTIDYVILIKSTQNFDDVVQVNVTTDGLPLSYQMPMEWFNWNNQTIRVASNVTVKLPLTLTIPPGQIAVKKALKVRANSTIWVTKGFDTGIITIS